MNFVKLGAVIELIKLEQTGPPQELAKKVAVSERMIYKYINCIKNDFKAPITYNRKKQSYCFEEKGSINLHWVSHNE